MFKELFGWVGFFGSIVTRSTPLSSHLQEAAKGVSTKHILGGTAIGYHFHLYAIAGSLYVPALAAAPFCT